ncbi:MAG: HDOD domain-containing protein [Planctomycetota bacterium]
MAIQGSLASLSVPELFTFFAHIRKTGVLTVVSGEHERSFLFYGGNLVHATTQDESKRLGKYLVRLGYVTEQALDEIFKLSFGKDAFFGRKIVELRRVTQDQLNRAVRAQIVDIVEEVSNWRDGVFHFDDTPLPFDLPEGAVVPAQNVILDLARQEDECGDVHSFFPDMSVVYELDQPPTGVSDDERLVLSLIDGRRSVEEVIFSSDLGPRATATGLEKLIEVGALKPNETRRRPSSEMDMQRLPVSTESATKVFAALNLDEEGARQGIESALSGDPLLVSKVFKILRLSNVEVCRADISVNRLIDLLGFFHLRCGLVPEAVRGFYFQTKDWAVSEFWSHSRQAAALCERIAKHVSYPYPDEAYLAGLLQNIGAFLMLYNEPRLYQNLVSKSFREETSIEELEREYFGTTHSQLGGKYAEKWAFPSTLTLVIKNHHACTTQLQSPLLYVVGVANGLLQQRGARVGFQAGLDEQFNGSLSRLNLSQKDAEGIFRELRRESDMAPRPRRSAESGVR